MSNAAIWTVIPVKPFALAKHRLRSVLDADQRAELARVMFEDVLDAAQAARASESKPLAGILVLTADEHATALAHQREAIVVSESAPRGINAALKAAIDELSNRGAGMLVLPADLPQISSRDIEEFASLVRAPRALALVQAASDRGTNLLACRPADLIVPRFGPRSFDRHVAASRDVGVRPIVVSYSGLDIDIDRPRDLAAFLTLGTPTRTHAFLSTLDLGDARQTRYNSLSPQDRSPSGASKL